MQLIGDLEQDTCEVQKYMIMLLCIQSRLDKGNNKHEDDLFHFR